MVSIKNTKLRREERKGDFNDLISQTEETGGGRHPRWLFVGFASVINECELHEIDFNGYSFTVERKFDARERVEEKLDRGFGCGQWCSML